MAPPAWLQEFADQLPPGPAQTAAKALLPYAVPHQLHGPVTAREHVSVWERQWLAANRRRGVMTARSYASRLRVALLDYAADREAR